MCASLNLLKDTRLETKCSYRAETDCRLLVKGLQLGRRKGIKSKVHDPAGPSHVKDLNLKTALLKEN